MSARPFAIVDCEQRSPEWFAARLGRVTGSRASDMLARIKSGEAAARRNLRVQLTLERITQRPHERNVQTWAMQQGVETEAEACGAYEALTGRLAQRTGFLAHPKLMAGTSLDGHVGDLERGVEGVIEVKCPLSATHLEYLTTGKVPTNYLWQVTHSLWLTGAAWCDWFSYDPAFPDPLKAKLVRINRSDVDLVAYERELLAFLAEVDRLEAEVRALMGSAA